MIRPFYRPLKPPKLAASLVTPTMSPKQWAAALKEQISFLREGHKACADPRAHFLAAFELIQQCFERQDFQLESGTEEFAAVKRAVEVIRHYVFVLNRTRLLDNVRMHRGALATVKILNRNTLWRELDAVRQQLSGETICQEEIVDAMNLFHRAILSMTERFTWGSIETEPEEEEDEPGADGREARLMCAAYLPALAALTRAVWQPLRKQIRRKRARRS
jgi:hypothetical protein